MNVPKIVVIFGDMIYEGPENCGYLGRWFMKVPKMVVSFGEGLQRSRKLWSEGSENCGQKVPKIVVTFGEGFSGLEDLANDI